MRRSWSWKALWALASWAACSPAAVEAPEAAKTGSVLKEKQKGRYAEEAYRPFLLRIFTLEDLSDDICYVDLLVPWAPYAVNAMNSIKKCVKLLSCGEYIPEGWFFDDLYGFSHGHGLLPPSLRRFAFVLLYRKKNLKTLGSSTCSFRGIIELWRK
jgi:hypothetical protein